MLRRLCFTLLLIGPAACEGDHGDTPDASTVVSPDQVIVSLTFDDTFADQFVTRPMLASHGMHATFFVNSPRVDHTGYMTRSQLQTLADDRNEIAGHTLSHPHLTSLSIDDARREICNDRAALIDLGFPVESFAYPFGDSNPMVEDVARECGYNSARNVGGLSSDASCAHCPFANPTPPADLYSVRTPASVTPETQLSRMEDYVLQAEAHGGGWVPLVFHHVCDGCSPIGVSPAVFENFLQFLDDRGTTVRTVQEVIEGDLQQAIVAP